MILKPFEPVWLVYTKRTALILCLAGAYLWVSTDEYEFEQQQLAHTHPHRVNKPAQVHIDPEELPVYPEPEQAIPGWIVPPEPVRKSVAKVKRKIKKSVEK
jgi:hypothetical protein